jgi:hypothetical protein
MRLLATVAAALAVAFSATSASATVSDDTSQASWHRCVYLSVWYQSYSGGSHYLPVELLRGHKLIVRRRLYATNHWHRYTLACPRKGLYTLVINGYRSPVVVGSKPPPQVNEQIVEPGPGSFPTFSVT